MNDAQLGRRLDRMEAALHRCNASLRLQRTLLATLHTITTAFGEGIMGKFDELEQNVTDLQAGVDTLTEAVSKEATEVAALTTELTKLRDAAANGGFIPQERIQSLIDRTQAMKQNLESASAAVANLAPTPEPESGEGEGEGGEGGEGSGDPPAL